MNLCIDIKTGRRAKCAAGFGKTWNSHKALAAWWTLSLFGCEATEYPDGHTWEVCAHTISPNSSSPTWPILAFQDRDMAKYWFDMMRKFLKTIPADSNWEHFDSKVSGDKRLGDWLTTHGFVRYNHVWWVLGE